MALAGRVGAGLASMRPRVFPAEDLDSSVATNRTAYASMRPRVFPAEDVRLPLDAQHEALLQ